MRRPVVAAIGTGAVLLALASPVLGMETKNGALDQFPSDHEVVQGFEAASRIAGAGSASPVQVVAQARAAGAAAAAAERLRAALADDPGIADVAAATPSRDGRAVLLVAQTRADPESPAAKATVDRLRDALPAAAGRDVRVDVGGVTASQRDLDDLVSGGMWKILLFLLGLSYIVLLVLLRSVVLPAKAVLMNLLSVGAAFGVLTLAFGEVDTLTPPLVLAVVFGLSMDYEVFLLTRIRERYEATGDTRLAVAQGLAASARTITSAALIMVAVFAVFVATGVPSIQQIGLGTAVAIALDATLVRLILVPATMELLGKWNWYLPRPLARVLPRPDFEAIPQPARLGEQPARAPERLDRPARAQLAGDQRAARVQPAGEHVDEVVVAHAVGDVGAVDEAGRDGGAAVVEAQVPRLGVGEVPLQRQRAGRRVAEVDAAAQRVEQQLHRRRVARRRAVALAQQPGLEHRDAAAGALGRVQVVRVRDRAGQRLERQSRRRAACSRTSARPPRRSPRP